MRKGELGCQQEVYYNSHRPAICFEPIGLVLNNFRGSVAYITHEVTSVFIKANDFGFIQATELRHSIFLAAPNKDI